jgi:hypothetical protein
MNFINAGVGSRPASVALSFCRRPSVDGPGLSSWGAGVPEGVGNDSEGSILKASSTSPSSFICHVSCGPAYVSYSVSSENGRVLRQYRRAFFFDVLGGFHSDSGLPARNAHHWSLSRWSGIRGFGTSPTEIVAWTTFCGCRISHGRK